MQTGQGIFSPVGEPELHTYRTSVTPDSKVHLGVFLALLTVPNSSSVCLLEREYLSMIPMIPVSHHCHSSFPSVIPQRPWSSLRGQRAQVTENHIILTFPFGNSP